MFRDIFKMGIEEAINVYAEKWISTYAYGTALNLCGNSGQRTIIENIGLFGYEEATIAALEGDDAIGVLSSIASHPDAVGDILEESGGMINDMAGGDL